MGNAKTDDLCVSSQDYRLCNTFVNLSARRLRRNVLDTTSQTMR